MIAMSTWAMYRAVRRALLLAAILPLGACQLDTVLDVSVPGRVREEALADPALAPTMVASVIADLECAWNNYSAAAAIMSDEFMQASGNLNQRNWGSRRITADDPNMATASCRAAYGIYTTLHTARFQAEDIFTRLDQFTDAQVPNRTALKATVRAYGAYALVALGEGFCEMVIDGGSDHDSTTKVLELAETRFTEAITLATAANNQDILNMALVGTGAGPARSQELRGGAGRRAAGGGDVCEERDARRDRHAAIRRGLRVHRVCAGPSCDGRTGVSRCEVAGRRRPSGAGDNHRTARLRQRAGLVLSHGQAPVARISGRDRVRQGGPVDRRRGGGSQRRSRDRAHADQRHAHGGRHSGL